MKITSFLCLFGTIILTSLAFYHIGVPVGIVTLLATVFISLLLIESAIQFGWGDQ